MTDGTARTPLYPLTVPPATLTKRKVRRHASKAKAGTIKHSSDLGALRQTDKDWGEVPGTTGR